MRIAVLADIHGNLAALEAVMQDVSRRQVDKIVNLGDSLSGPLLPAETARILMSQPWIHVSGNHERQLLTLGYHERNASDQYTHSCLSAAVFDWMKSLPATLQLGTDVLLCHGTPRSDQEYFLETVGVDGVRPATLQEIEDRMQSVTSPVLLCGHTHMPRVVRTSRHQLVINPGSVGLPAYDDILPLPHVIETGTPDACYAIVEQTCSGWSTQHIHLPYNHRMMAKLAKENQRPDWEEALLTGRCRQ